VFVILPGRSVFALTSSEQSSIDNDSIYYDSGQSQCDGSGASSSSAGDCCSLVTGPSSGGPLLSVQFPELADTGALATNINSYIQTNEPSSPFIGMGSIYVAAGQKYDVNPALMVAIAVKESSLGTNQPSGSNDAWGLTAQGDVADYPYENGIYYFPSWTVGIYEASMYVGNNYALPGSSYYSTTVMQLMEHYTPDNVTEQTQVTLGVMQAIVNGLSTNGTPTTSTTTSTTPSTSSSCTSSTTTSSGLTNPFPNGWVPGRLDMGYDGSFDSQIVAPCSGTMSYVDADSDHSYNGGWEGAYFTLECSQAPSGLPANTSFYFAEGVQPIVSQGQTVTAGQKIAVPGWTGYTEGPGGIEWGIAVSSDPQETYAASLGNSCVVGSASQVMVMNFSKWVQQNLDVAPPATTDHAGCA
jgi:hypothetical protein